MHWGVDITNRAGTPITAGRSGKVVFSGLSGGYGQLVKIAGANGTTTYYAHLSRRTVSVGASVLSSTKIGEMGQTGNATGPHLHLEVWQNGSRHNPLSWYHC
ncbi:M23 family metallopeptidase [Streptomyces hydrogenans]